MTDEQRGKEVRDQLTELWKTTVGQLDEIKDVIVRHSQVGRKKLDTAFLKKQRDKLFQELGEVVFRQHEAEGLTLVAEAQRLVERIQEAIEQIATQEEDIERISAAVDEDIMGSQTPSTDEHETHLGAEAGVAGTPPVEAVDAVMDEDTPVETPSQNEDEPEQSAAEPAAEPKPAPKRAARPRRRKPRVAKETVDDTDSKGDKGARPRRRPRRKPRVKQEETNKE